MSHHSSSSLTLLDRLWLAESVRLTEEQTGLLDDAEANRRARAAGGDLEQRILTRAEWLAQRDGLLQGLHAWRDGSWLALLVLIVLVSASGVGLAWAVLGDSSRPVNLFWALASLLGLHWLTLLLWCYTLLAGNHIAPLGRLWLWLAQKLARNARSAQLAPSLLQLLYRQRLGRWGLGLLIHGLWLLFLLATLIVLLLLFSVRRYGFVWETTLFSSDSFIALTQTLGRLPAVFGFALPDPDTIRASGDSPLLSEGPRQIWAQWLIGAMLIYGLLPRALAGLVCFWRWRRGLRRLKLDLSLPGYSMLCDRLSPGSERLGISDPDSGHAEPPPPPLPIANRGQGALLVAIELDSHYPWPPALPAGVADGGIIDDGNQRRRLLERLTHSPPARLIMACDPRRSPDRGTLILLQELSRCTQQARVWLLPPPSGELLDSDRLGDWRNALEQRQLTVCGELPLRWLESSDD